MIPRRARRAMHQINVVPYIDVMLVLLVIFMVTAPFINPSQIDLPSVAKSSLAPEMPLEVMVRADGSFLLRDRNVAEEGVPVSETELRKAIAARQKMLPNQPVVISADKAVRYDAVMRVMDTLQRLGVARVGLMVKPAQS
jgi:biopolymer transport protein TolR